MTTDSKGKEKVQDPSTNNNLPWIEKYRPTTLDEVSGHDSVIKTIRKFVDSGKIPHMLMYGPPGTGKTSTIQAIAREIYGKNYKNMVLELNASDDRGIDVVREQIKTFASTRQIFSKGFKLIILDECDAMTNSAQNALRRVIEKYTTHTRFCILANYAHKITPAVQSRCTKFRFSPLPQESIKSRIRHVIECENVNLTPEAFSSLLVLSKGDMRRALNVLQACHASVDDEGQQITDDMVYDCIGSPRPADVKYIMDQILNADWETALSSINKVKVDRGLALADVLTEFAYEFQQLDLSNETRIELLIGLSEIEWRMSSGGNELIQTSATIGLIKQSMELQKA